MSFRVKKAHVFLQEGKQVQVKDKKKDILSIFEDEEESKTTQKVYVKNTHMKDTGLSIKQDYRAREDFL
jgi:hypothetical protein